LVDAVSSYTTTAQLEALDENGTCASSYSEPVLVHACLDSAIRTIDLLRILLDYEDIPKRLPFVVNSVFVSALVLGLAHFGDLGKTFPVDASLNLAHRLLSRFPHDAIARRNMTIVSYLIQACDNISQKRKQSNRDRQALLIGKMFGNIHDGLAGKISARVTTDDLPNATVPCLPEVANQFSRAQQTSGAPKTQQDNARRLGTTVEGPYQDAGFARSESGSGHEESHFLNDPFMDAYMTSEGFGESMPLMSPRTLWFDPYSEKLPLFSTVDTSTT
jgi:hypothetical protein